MVKECVECGRPFIANVANRKVCSQACSDIRMKRHNDEKNARARAATIERIGVKICKTCGKEFTPNHPAKVCCSPECQKIRERQLVNNSIRSAKLREQQIKCSEKQISDINAKAREMGMTYGQYVAYVEGKKAWNGSQRKMDS